MSGPMKDWQKRAYEVLDLYQKKMGEMFPHTPPQKMPTSQLAELHYGTGRQLLLHAAWMLEVMPNFVMSLEIGKFYRWLGFVQGVFAAHRVYTIDEMREHNRGLPSAEDPGA